MRYYEMLDELERIEAECGCELPELSDPTPLERAERIVNCDDPPVGSDLEFVRHIIGGKVECETHWIAWSRLLQGLLRR